MLQGLGSHQAESHQLRGVTRIPQNQQMGLTQTRQSAPIPQTGHMHFPAAYHYST